MDKRALCPVPKVLLYFEVRVTSESVAPVWVMRWTTPIWMETKEHLDDELSPNHVEAPANTNRRENLK